MTRTSQNRRERLRTATVAEIKDAARRLLVTGGPAAISLRAIARDMGMTAPAIYRYFPGLDALVEELCVDLYTELRQVIEAARDEVPPVQPTRRLAAMGRAFRHWSVTHRPEFSLMFGEPLPGVAEFDSGGGEQPHDASAQFGDAFMTEFVGLWQRNQFQAPPPEVISEALRTQLLDRHGDAVPVEVVYVFLSAWVRLYGIVALEVFGHLRWALTDPEPMFETELAAFIHQLTGSAVPEPQ